MTNPLCSAHARFGRRDRFVSDFAVLALPILAALALAMSTPARAEDRIDPCEGYQVYVAIGGEDSGPATALKRVCETIGPVTITQPCLVYYTRLTDTIFPPDDELRARLAGECEASMPGGTGLWTEPADDPDAPGGPCRDRPCVGDDPVLVPMPDPNATAPADLLECGAGLECRPEPVDLPPAESDAAAPTNAQVTGAAPQSVQAASSLDPTLDLAFWQAIVGSSDPALFQAYLDRFPNGTFAPIAAARLEALGAGSAPTTPLAAPSAMPPAAAPAIPAKSPQQLFDEAEAIMSAAYQSDESHWGEAAQRAMPLYRAAGDGGWAPAYFELGALAENGIGMVADPDLAIDNFLKAGRLGFPDGYFRALMVLDQVDNGPLYVETFLTFYRIAPERALGSLEAVGRNGPMALQRHLGDHGYYQGTLDGAFGPGSRAALAAYVSGAPPAVAAPAAAAGGGDTLAADLQTALARVGCYATAIDGRWGQGSAKAMTSFNLWNGSSLATDRPTEQALRVVSATPGMICGVD